MARLSRDSDRIQNPPRNNENSVRAPAARSSQCVTIRPTGKGDRQALLANAPSCVQAMANDGVLPKNDVEFSIGVRWLLSNEQDEGLRELLRAPDCSEFHKLDLHGEPITADELGLLARSLDSSSITILDLSGCQLNELHADAIEKLKGPGSKVMALYLDQDSKSKSTARDEQIKLNDSIYENHPISLDSILASVKRDGKAGNSQDELQKYDTNTVGGTKVVMSMADMLKIGKDDHIVDIGAGLGGPLRTILTKVPGATATGIDASESRVKGAIELNDRTGMRDRVKMLTGFSGEHYVKGTVVTAFDVVSHIGTPKQAIAELMKHAQPGARVGLTCQCIDPELNESQRTQFEYVRTTWGGHIYTKNEWKEAVAQVAAGEPQFIGIPDASAHLALEIEHAKGNVASDSPEILSRQYAKNLVDAEKMPFVAMAFESSRKPEPMIVNTVINVPVVSTTTTTTTTETAVTATTSNTMTTATGHVSGPRPDESSANT